MKNIFLIFGYGIPKNILKDENYNFYLKMVFNRIYDITTKSNITNPIIICTGGETDMYKPYERTEAEEMIRLLEKLATRPFLKKVTKNWQFIPEKKSLSSLENLLYGAEIIKKKNIKKPKVFIFCEQTREKIIKILANKILNNNYSIKVIPIDFDISPNRYVDPKFLLEKEQVYLKHSLRAFKSPENLKKFRKIFEEKIEFLRQAGPGDHTRAVKEWWEQKLKELE